MASTERLINFPAKPVPAGSDIVYVGDMSDSGNEVKSTIAEMGAAMSGVVLLVANNLSDLASASAARTNLGLGSAATHAATDFLLVANNLSDLSSASTARSNLGLGTAAVQNVGFFAQVANNLSDLSSAATARTNLGLGTAAVKSASGSGSVLASVTGSFTIGHVATFADTNGTIQDGGSLSGFLLAANNLSDVASASTSRTNLGLGNAAVANQTSVTNLVASISGAITVNHYAQFADNFGTLKDGGTAPAGVLLSANNLSDVNSVSTSRTNLGLGTAATKAASDNTKTTVAMISGSVTTGHYAVFADSSGTIDDGGATPAGVLLAVNNLSDVASASTSRTNLGLGTAATQNSTFFAQVANNLSDLASASTARTNLGLGTAATHAATDFLLAANNLSDLASTATAITNLFGGSTGSGNVVRATSPTLVTPALGTPASGVLTNMTGTQAGTATNNNAAAGQVGEYISSQVLAGSAVSLTTGATINVTSISLTAGDWDVVGNVNFIGGGSCVFGYTIAAIWTTSASLPDQSLWGITGPSVITGSTDLGCPAPSQRFSLASTTTIYLLGSATFSGGTAGGSGYIGARRAR